MIPGEALSQSQSKWWTRPSPAKKQVSKTFKNVNGRSRWLKRKTNLPFSPARPSPPPRSLGRSTPPGSSCKSPSTCQSPRLDAQYRCMTLKYGKIFSPRLASERWKVRNCVCLVCLMGVSHLTLGWESVYILLWYLCKASMLMWTFWRPVPTSSTKLFSPASLFSFFTWLTIFLIIIELSRDQPNHFGKITFSAIL